MSTKHPVFCSGAAEIYESAKTDLVVNSLFPECYFPLIIFLYTAVCEFVGSEVGGLLSPEVGTVKINVVAVNVESFLCGPNVYRMMFVEC